MHWRVHLANRVPHRLDMLAGRNSNLLAAWSQPDRVTFFDMESGALVGERQVEVALSEARQYDRWQALLPEIKAPNGVYPSVLSIDGWRVYLDCTARLRVLISDEGEIIIARGPDEEKIAVRAALSVGLDRASGHIIILDAEGNVRICDQSGALSQPIPEITVEPGARTALAVVESGAGYIASERTLLRLDRQGKLSARTELHYSIGQFACSPDGHLLACADLETNVLRVYSGDHLTPLYQGHAVDLMAKTTQLQLIADLPPARAAISNLAIDNRGVIAFALAGVICVTAVDEMRQMPPLHQINHLSP